MRILTAQQASGLLSKLMTTTSCQLDRMSALSLIMAPLCFLIKQQIKGSVRKSNLKRYTFIPITLLLCNVNIDE